MTRRRKIPRRKRVFVGCEGESERGYTAFLSQLLKDQGRYVHLDTVRLGGGDPLAIVQTAERQLRRRNIREAPYAARAIFLDADRRTLEPNRSAQAIALALRLKALLIWQRPCHEALLLRHLPDCERLRPTTAPLATTQLQRQWPEYAKPMPAVRLAMRLDHEAVLRAAGVEEELKKFLGTIGFAGSG